MRANVKCTPPQVLLDDANGIPEATFDSFLHSIFVCFNLFNGESWDLLMEAGVNSTGLWYMSVYFVIQMVLLNMLFQDLITGIIIDASRNLSDLFEDDESAKVDTFAFWERLTHTRNDIVKDDGDDVAGGGGVDDDGGGGGGSGGGVVIGGSGSRTLGQAISKALSMDIVDRHGGNQPRKDVLNAAQLRQRRAPKRVHDVERVVADSSTVATTEGPETIMNGDVGEV